MAKNNKAFRGGSNVAEYILPISKHLDSRGRPTVDIEIFMIRIRIINSTGYLDTHHPCRT